jgi:lipopolysaccharide transport system ATP-binding protein
MELMTDLAIRVENLSKLYQIGRAQQRHDTMRDALVAGLRAPLERLRRNSHSPDSLAEDTIWALRDVSFEVKRGEIVGIIGRNGAGKSTLLKILSQITEPTMGQATLNGLVSSLLEVGTGFHPELTGRENVYFGGAILGMSRVEIRRKFDEIVAFSGVKKFIDTPVKRYSSGMRVRLAFSVAAHLEPNILLVDEVLAVGDADFQKKCLGKMGEVAQEGRTVLFVSHNMGAIMDLTERCIFLKSGKVASDGPSHKTVEEYLREVNFALSRDLSAAKRAAWKGQKPLWQITHVTILAPESGLIANSPIEVELKYASYRNLEDIVVGVGITNTFGTRLISCRSDDDGTIISAKEGGSGTILVRIESPYLAPGRYILQVVAMQKNNTLDYISDALTFEISTDVSDLWAVGRPHLGLRLPSKWQHHRLSAEQGN